MITISGRCSCDEKGGAADESGRDTEDGKESERRDRKFWLHCEGVYNLRRQCLASWRRLSLLPLDIAANDNIPERARFGDESWLRRNHVTYISGNQIAVACQHTNGQEEESRRYDSGEGPKAVSSW